MTLELSVAGLCLRLIHEQPLEITERFAPFVCTDRQPDLVAVFREVDTLPAVLPAVYEDVCWRLHPDGRAGFLRTFFDAPRDRVPYALGRYDWAKGRIEICYLPKGRANAARLENCFFNLAWETLLLHEQRLVLHAACVDTPLGGILFSGPTGIGKSTQAKHWCAHLGARLINDDRPVLEQTPDGWRAWGAPYAGSSHIYINESCPVRAIVLLKQGRRCSLRPLRGREAFSAVYRQLTLNSFDSWAVERACDLTQALISAVPVLEYTCTAEPEAAKTLYKEVAAL